MLVWCPPLSDPAGALRAARAIEKPERRLSALLTLARHDRDALCTHKLDTSISALMAGGASAAAGLAARRLAVLGSHSVEHLLPAIRVGAAARGVAAATHVGGYGQFRQELLIGDTALAAFAPDTILLATDAAALLPAVPLNSTQEVADAAVASATESLIRLWHAARSRYGAMPLQQTLARQATALIGCNEHLLPGSPATLAAELDRSIRRAAAREGVPLIDLSRLPEAIGSNLLIDPVRWHQAKQLINPVLAPLFGELVAQVLAAQSGKSRKCLVLDCDHTLWGGVVGDDGLAGLRLGQGSPEGEAFAAFQRYVAGLARRGIILAVCSKNDETVARSVFDLHPEMVLRSPDIACFVANWQDKASNLRSIAATLNIGVDSLVFVDDNPVERAIVRRELPEVAVPELPGDVCGYPERIAAAGWFETVQLTGDDFARATSYAANAHRALASAQATDVDGFLSSLDMVMDARPIGALDRARAVQLINKSNQFNLTTLRRTPEELQEVLATPGALALAVRLRDAFGDSGLVSVVIARPDAALPADAWLIDTWLMSCRVLGRGVERAVLGVLLEAAKKRNVSMLTGMFRPSGRNHMVEQHYASLGFTACAGGDGLPEDATYWRLAVAGAVPPPHHIKVHHDDDAAADLCRLDAGHV
ncbi:HAD-IIIC family phosphatase [Sphingomonas aracearum]|uniref:HAD-IIIC family phosphatase n=1 Tax=Sphingomonas aracearum TaxID=2283317 RepID=A0A369VV83_9SPHN|nr:HAD-IIIC family phosphatase [Sphingomonas aracearum]RDE06296.1 HAD-IIIC family phosphatase [Sphingomonas aracearum]